MPPPIPAGFVLPNLDAPIDLDAVIAGLPRVARIRGMFMQGIVDGARKKGAPLLGFGPYIAFKDYEVSEHVRLLGAACDALHVGVPKRRALVSMGRSAYETMVDTLIGRVIFGVLGRDINRITKLVGKAYEIAGQGVTAELLDVGEGFSHVRIEGASGLVDNYHVGAFEGVLSVCGQTGEVRCKLDARGGELFTLWRPLRA